MAKTATPHIPIKRIHTTAGVHPYDEVTWELRDVVQTNWKNGETIFEQRGVEFPADWSVNAATIVTTKYFRGALGTDARETSLKQLIDRVVNTYTQAGKDNGYFASDEDAEIFDHELKYALLHQVFSFNSPVWFNVGTSSPQQVSACFILSVEDSMDSILNWYKEEGFIFKGGSGAGLNLSRIRSSKELLSSGGTASGPVSFMRGADASAGTIKSGGACLAPWTKVYTCDDGAVEVSALSERSEDFTTLSYNPMLGRMQATRARAFESGRKMLVKLTTDKGEFTMSSDHPVMLMSGGYVPVGELREGMSIRPGSITISELGYHRVGLQDGTKRKESVHRLVARDVLGDSIEGHEVHHLDRNPGHNAPSNLLTVTRAEHLRIHAAEDLEAGVHPLQQFHGVGNHPLVSGDCNGMSFASGNRTDDYRANQSAGMRREGVYQLGQDAAARQRMINKAYEIVNSGGSIDTFDEYFEGRRHLAGGKMGYSKSVQMTKIEERFGSFEAFREEVRANNHRVLSVENLHESVVYDVEVDSNTPEDRSANDGHNFMIVSETNSIRGLSGIMVHNTRRAAKMVVLDVDHPDIEEFVETKAREEDKIRALRDAGFDMDLGGRDIVSVQYQNANNSVRVSDEFMTAVEKGTTFGLRARSTGDVIETVDARELFDKINTAAWECADPGVQYDDTINAWHTTPNTGPITASNPCSEYMSLDNSSCNLASLNLLKFLREDGTFDAATFEAMVELVITAMDISICFADFPTEPIGETTRNFRQLGIGYANLGALLMATGHGYDSDGGRNVAAAITSLMTGAAYKRSAQISAVVGPYAGYAENAKPHRAVMSKHAAANDELRENADMDEMATSIHERATKAWASVLRLGGRHGFRNAQASVLAPTGTIGFMMDCDTTGIEPDFSLVKFKKLVGGGSMQIVNQTIPRALDKLGYETEQIAQIVEYISENGHVVDAPGLRPEHYEVFDCAMGRRAISPMGHVRMMAACQPFLSGAISKTVNLPETATVEEIADVHMQGWKMGLKAVAVYRDNCKVGQPLSDGKAEKKDEPAPVTDPVVETVIEYRPTRRRLPKRRDSKTTSFAVGGAEGYLTAGTYENGDLGELFLKFGKQGSTLAGVMDAFSIAVSIGLQYGVPLETFVEKFVNHRFEPAGMTDDPDVRMAQSIMDYVFRRLALDYLDFDTRSFAGIYTAAERARQLETGSYTSDDDALDTSAQDVATRTEHKPVKAETPAEVDDVHSSAELVEKMLGKNADAPMCMTCGTKMRPAGSCYVCEGCGSTSGCS